MNPLFLSEEFASAVIPADAGIHLRMWVNERRRFISRRCAGTLTKGEKRKHGFRLSPE